ncbi:MAG: endonuclease/exonuclease/phosphatase family protein [Kangiellaceae bacterium]
MEIDTSSQSHRINLLSYNLQVGIKSNSYSDYITQSWRHLLPDSDRTDNLTRAADWLSEYDIVALQEVDAGSLRSNYVNQIEYLADKGGFPHYHQQQNRHFAGLASHSNGVLTKYQSTQVNSHKLPGRIAGRGALEIDIISSGVNIKIISVHLALGQKARAAQLEYIANLVKKTDHFIIMGDMNCKKDTVSRAFKNAKIEVNRNPLLSPTYPRWNPRHCYDQIWVSKNLRIIKSEVLNVGVSDHLPITMEIEIPANKMNIQSTVLNQNISRQYIN